MKRIKKIVVLIVIMSGMLMTGCLVSSLHPFYKTKDIIYDEVIEGEWIDGDSSIWIIHRNYYSESFMGEEKPDNSYKVVYYEETNSKSVLKGTLFQLNGVQYIDFLPDPDHDHCESDMTSIHMLPTHTLARVQFNSDSILLYWYGEDWLNDLLEQNRIKIEHATIRTSSYTSRHVLTASTDELQKFIEKYANDPRIVEQIDQIFEREGDTDDQDAYGLFLKLKPYNGNLPEDEN